MLRFAWLDVKSLWFDEAFSLKLARQPLWLVARITSDQDAHPPLYYLLLHGWITLFGTSETALRSLGALCSSVAATVTGVLGIKMVGRQVGLLAALLAAVSPLQVMAAQEARMYPLATLLVLLSWWALWEAVGGRRWMWVLYSLFAVTGLYTHYLFLAALGSHGAFLMAGRHRAHLRGWLLAVLGIVVAYVPWWPVFFDSLFSGRGWPFVRPPVGLRTLPDLLALFSFGGDAFETGGYFTVGTLPLAAYPAVLFPFLAWLTLGAWSLRRRVSALKALALYWMAPVLACYAMSFKFNIFYGRYFSIFWPGFAILMAAGVLELSAVFSRAWSKGLVVASVLLVLLYAVPVLHAFYFDPRQHRFNWRDAAKLVMAEAAPNDLVVVVPAFAITPWAYYFKGPQSVMPMLPKEFLNPSSLLARGNAEDPADLAYWKGRMKSLSAASPTLWLVVTKPMPAHAAKRLDAILAGICRYVRYEDFRHVEVVKCVRNDVKP
ncbi:MAG: glycosyltransferase family 39 protein [Armatimonadota bacterium]|nr:glycosyltransferase family 39 protein [Armatimonadota bacterium]